MYRVWKLKTGLGRRNPASGAIWKLRRSPDRIGFRYPSADTTQRFPRNTTDCTTIPGPKANFVVFVILQIMPKRLTNENQARKVTQTRININPGRTAPVMVPKRALRITTSKAALRRNGFHNPHASMGSILGHGLCWRER